MKTWVKIFDFFIILIVAALTFFAVYTVYLKPQGQVRILIRGHESEWTFPVDAEETIIVSGPLGNTTVQIHNQNAWIESSPCDNKTCVAAGFVSKQGQWSACLPNNVLLIVYGSGDDYIDRVVW